MSDDLEVQRLRKMIRDFCNGQEWADELWRCQSHIKPLFDEVQDSADKAPGPGVRCRHCGEEIEYEQGQFWVHRNSLSMFCSLSAEPVEDGANAEFRGGCKPSSGTSCSANNGGDK